MAVYPHALPVPAEALHAPSVGARLRALREKRDLSREEAAAEFRRRTGTSTATNTLARWESTGSLKVQELIEMAALLGCDPVWLLVGKDLRDLQAEDEALEAEAQDRRVRGGETGTAP